MIKNDLQKRMEELGIISIEDANSSQTIEDAISAIEELQKDPKMLAAPLVIDATTDRKFFNTKEKILAYFIEKNITDIKMQREILSEVMGATSTFYTGNPTEEQKLLLDIEMYLNYAWVYALSLK